MRSALCKPVSEGADGLLAAVDVSEAEGVDDASSGAEQTDVSLGANVEFRVVDVEGRGVESVPADRGCGSWLSYFAWQGDVDNRWDLVGELVSGERRSEAQGCLGCSDADLEKVVVDVKSGQDVDPAAQGLEACGIAPFVELAVGDSMGARVGVRERER